MFGEVAKLFDRNFFVAYLVPAAGFVSASHFLATRIIKMQPLFILAKQSLFENVALFSILTVVVAVMLSVLNRGLVRLLEGYWPFGLGTRLNYFQRKRYDQLLEQETQLNAERDRYPPDDVPESIRLKRNAILRTKARQFPDRPHLILPTGFGNTFRAFETYPRSVYGIDAIPGWFRLLGVVPPDYRSLIDASRATIDLWVNFCFLALLTIIEFVVFHILSRYTNVTPRQTLFWFPVLMLAVVVLGYRLATSAVAEWGNWVKAAFDLYLPELRKKLEFPPPANAEEQRAMWTGFNQATVYRHAQAMPARTTYDPTSLQEILDHAKLHFTKSGLELLLSVLKRTEQSAKRTGQPDGKT